MITKNFKQLYSGKLAWESGSYNCTVSGEFKSSDGTDYTKLYTTPRSSAGSSSWQELVLYLTFRGSTDMDSATYAINGRAVMFNGDISENDYQLETSIGTPLITRSASGTNGFTLFTVTNGGTSDITFNGVQIYEQIATTNASTNRKSFLVIEEKFSPITLAAGESKTWQISPRWAEVST